MIKYNLSLFPFLFMYFLLFAIIDRVPSISAIESPSVEIFPECGSLNDHRVYFTADGFNLNGNVQWEIINSRGEIDSYGYFETDAIGNFDEFIIADELEPDTYTLRFFDDKDNDSIKDPDGSEVILKYQIPCANPIF